MEKDSKNINLKKDFNNMEKQMHGHIDHIHQQNVKMNEINEKLNSIEQETHKSEKYQEIIEDESFFGPVKRFFGGLFSKKSQNKTNINEKKETNNNQNNTNKNNLNNNNPNIKKEINKKEIKNDDEINNEQDLMDLIAEVSEMKKTSQQLYNAAKESNENTNDLKNRIEDIDEKVKKRNNKNLDILHKK